jgi:hypothetical protein
VAGLAFFSCKKKPLFEQVPSSHSNIHFDNLITENDSVNPLNMVYVYNGGGVGIGDFNNDGLQDIYFTGNMVPNRLYLNEGDFKFKDVTAEAGVRGMGRWGRGVAVVDINNDGLMDIYVCNAMSSDSTKLTNLLYVNQGVDKNGVLHFKEMAKEYGLNVNVQSTMATFFDYDNDGVLDMYLTVNEANANDNPGKYDRHVTNGLHRKSIGLLFKGVWDAKLKHPVFHNVTAQAGMNLEGYGLAATVADINQDGWKDIYVSDDFLSSDILWVNNGNGTFKDRSKEYFKHTSLNAMGQDIIDINNDGLEDVFTLDMNPEDNYRKKMMLNPISYQGIQNFDFYGYQYQYVRNTLQLNQGPRVLGNDSVGSPAFSEIGFLAGIAQTDWSWSPLIADFDNDGYRDVVITNGFPKDITDRDFMNYRQNAYATTPKKDLLKQVPSVKIPNYGYKNNGNLTFKNVSKEWGLELPTFSNGAAYADLNNDGAMDIVINNIDDEPLIYKNTARTRDTLNTHYLQIKFKGNSNNINGLGTWADVYYDHGKHQTIENNPYRGYLSTYQNIAHFGLGKVQVVDSVVIRWYDLKKQVLQRVKTNQVITADIRDAKTPYTWTKPVKDAGALFTDVTATKKIKYVHDEQDFVDFNIQKLIPHKLSQYTPALAVGDVDGNGLDDIVIGGTFSSPAQVLLQQKDGTFVQRPLFPKNYNYGNTKDECLLLFDANGDGKPDLYVASGGYANAPGDAAYQDRLFINDGKGNFTLSPAGVLPINHTSKLCVRAIDYNKDGKPDLFVSGRVEPWNYPKPVSSMILRNDSQNGQVKFTDVTAEVAPDLKNIGMVTDAIFSDYDNDGWPDLILTGEWMPVTFLKNDHGKFRNMTAGTGISDKLGWWNSITAGDFRHTGHMDYIVGNVGLNTFYKASDQYPVYITAGDFDHNGSYDALPSLYLPDKEGDKQEFPAFGREDLLKQMISKKKTFTNYKSYAVATLQDVLTPEQLQSALRLKMNTTTSCYLRNDGNGKFTMIPLPEQAQFSVLNGMVVDDFDGDGNLDVLINGNDYGNEVTNGRYDALNGLLLKGDGKGNFTSLSILQSGIYIPGDGKALVKLKGANGHYLVAASQNRGPLKLFDLKRHTQQIAVRPTDSYATITDKNGRKTKMELFNGSSFLSQSGRFILIDNQVVTVTITDAKGHQRFIPIVKSN